MTNTDSQRDKLGDILAAALTYLTDYVDPPGEIADTILSEGYRKPRTITTVEELDALPDHTIVRDHCGPLERYTSAWPGKRGWYVGDNPANPVLPATVLWEPEA